MNLLSNKLKIINNSDFFLPLASATLLKNFVNYKNLIELITEPTII